MPPYEINKIVRAAGYEPLTRPRREGTTYVVRATNYRGILMRVVVDARSGAIRAVNRIVPGPSPYGVVGMMGPPPYGGPYDPPIGPLPGPPPPYGAPPYGASAGPPPPYPPPPYPSPPYPSPYPPPYGAPPGYGMTPDMIEPSERPMEADLGAPPSTMYSHPPAPPRTPLPRPRPPDFATREGKPPRNADDKPAETPAIKSAPAPASAAATTAPSPGAPMPPPAAAPTPSPSPPAALAPVKKPTLPQIQD